MDAYHVMMHVMYAIRNLDWRAPTSGGKYKGVWSVLKLKGSSGGEALACSFSSR